MASEFNLRTFTGRSEGIFRKCNTLHNKLGPRIFVYIDPPHGTPSGYASQIWPELATALVSLNINASMLKGPDDFDTVRDRSFSSQPSQTTGSPPPQASGNSRDEHVMAEMLASVLTPTPAPNGVLRSTPETIGNASAAFESPVHSDAMSDKSRLEPSRNDIEPSSNWFDGEIRLDQGTPDRGSRKRRLGSGQASRQPSRRRKMTTRSRV